MQSAQEYERSVLKIRELARQRPEMFLGIPERAHYWPLKSALHLIWVAPLLRQTKRVTVVVSPNQYLILAESGPLLPPIQKCLTCENKYLLTEGWDEAILQRPPTTEKNRKRHWSYAWTGPTGPRFQGMLAPSLFSHHFFFGVRFESQFWGQLLKDSYPTATPSPLEVEPSLGLVISAHLDSAWFTGLPFRSEEAQTLRNYSTDTSYLYKDKRTDELKFVLRRHPRRFPETTGVWHDRDDLFLSGEVTLHQQLHQWARLRAHA